MSIEEIDINLHFRFGSGYTVTIRALNYTSSDVIKAFMDDVFPGSTLKVTIKHHQLRLLR